MNNLKCSFENKHKIRFHFPERLGLWTGQLSPLCPENTRITELDLCANFTTQLLPHRLGFKWTGFCSCCLLVVLHVGLFEVTASGVWTMLVLVASEVASAGITCCHRFCYIKNAYKSNLYRKKKHWKLYDISKARSYTFASGYNLYKTFL